MEKVIKNNNIDNGSNYCKFPDGTLICWGYSYLDSIPGDSFMTEVSAVFPIQFITAPTVTATVHKWDDPRRLAVGIKNLSIYSVQIRVGNSYTSELKEVGVLWQAIGRWK